MSHLPTDPTRFAERAIDGGVMRRAPMAPGQVGVVVGGGSGHYPAFAGLVGPGMAAAAVCGNIFASPAAPAISSS